MAVGFSGAFRLVGNAPCHVRPASEHEILVGGEQFVKVKHQLQVSVPSFGISLRLVLAFGRFVDGSEELVAVVG